MINKKYLSLIVMLLVVLSINAAPRTKQAITSAAAQVLSTSKSSRLKYAPRHDKLVELKANESVTIMGYKSGGYAIIGNDDLLPLVIGYSDTKYDSSNPGLQWYLNSVNAAAKNIVKTKASSTITKPDPNKYPTSVEPLIKTKWGQTAPYNNMCPVMNDNGDRAVTGCVATAAAQILYYNHYPLHGYGMDSVIVYSENKTKYAEIVDFSKSHYDFDNMLTEYSKNYTQAQSDAVAKLMLDCGIASAMHYTRTGSDASAGSILNGLTKYFGYPNGLKLLDRSKYAEPQWMNIVYKELSEKRAILYSGFRGGEGHSFVIDGYNSDGLVHVNWGWNGYSNGYYNIAFTNKGDTQFPNSQTMIIGIRGYSEELGNRTINVETPGTLSSLLFRDDTKSLSSLKVIGTINSSDIKQLRYFTGRDSIGNVTDGNITTLDLSDANIVSGGEPYLIENGVSYTTDDNALPERAFYHCESLKNLYLPTSIKSLGDGAVGGLVNLDSLYIPTGTDKNYIIMNNVVYNKDTTEIIMAFPKKYQGNYTAPREITKIHSYAFEGCDSIAEFKFFGKVNYIGKKALANMTNINAMKVSAAVPPTLGGDVFENIPKLRKGINIPYGSLNLYTKENGWKDFSFKEYGTKIIANHVVKAYGDSIKLTYKAEGENFTGEPILSTDADITSYIGDYPIHVDKGTVEPEEGGLMLVDSILTVDYAILNIHFRDTTIYRDDMVNFGEEGSLINYNGGFNNFTIKGFRLGETISDVEYTLRHEMEARFYYNDGEKAIGHLYMSSNSDSDIPCFIDLEKYCFMGDTAIITIIKADPTGIKSVTDNYNGKIHETLYNLAGQKVGSNYKGLVIGRNRKFIKR